MYSNIVYRKFYGYYKKFKVISHKGVNMNIFNIFLKYFSKKKLKKVQLFIQIFTCTLSVLIFTGMLFNIINKRNDIENITPLTNIKGNLYIKDNDNYEIVDRDISSLISQLKSNSTNFDFCQFVNQFSDEEINQLYIDDNLNKCMNFSVCKGRALTNEDFKINYNEQAIPILVSSRLEDKYPLNSEFKDLKTSFTNEINYYNGGPSFKVVGILDDSSSFWINDEILLDKLNYFDVIVYPIDFNKLNFNPPYYFINLKSNNNVYNDIKKQLEINYPNIVLKDSTLKDSFNDKLNNKIIELIFIGIFTIILLILSLFGFVSIIHSMQLLRNKEIGIHYCLGASVSNLLGFALLEIFTISISAICLCYLIINKFSNYLMLNYEILLNNKTFFISILTIASYILIASIAIIQILLKKEPIELIRD